MKRNDKFPVRVATMLPAVEQSAMARRINAARAGFCVCKNAGRWLRFKRPKQEHDGQFLVQMRDGSIHLGEFYCGAFVQDGFYYNDTPGLISQIKYIQAVKPPNERKRAGGR